FAKADYYIAHPDECKQIAINGAQIVKEAFNYSDRINSIFEYL
ncbi:MAG: glycosyltransferase family 1 protein, partial [Lachnospiraceae bacterium]|nr:glycosyltransferase family 1 protein [Candidatus Colinaster scatohippi]